MKVLVHGANLSAKEKHRTKYKDSESQKYLAEIRANYNEWHTKNMELVGPSVASSENDLQLIKERVALFEDYKAFLDQQHYAEKIDSRSNLHSSALEEFMYYLFKDLLSDFGKQALAGKSEVFKDIFFAPSSYSQMLAKPSGTIETKDHDFIIGVTVQASLQTTEPGITIAKEGSKKVEQLEHLSIDTSVEASESVSSIEQEEDIEQKEDNDLERSFTVSPENLSDFSKTLGTGNAEIHFFDIPAVVIECKTYLDKTMLEGSSRAAEELKARNPNALYIVVMESIKLSNAVDLRKYKVDQIYVLRKQKNTDREKRYLETYAKNTIDSDVVAHLFRTVHKHLTTDWVGGVEHGLKRGWLLD